MMTLWDILDPDIQRYIHLLAVVSVARDKWRGYIADVSNVILDLIYSTRSDILMSSVNNSISIAETLWDIELYFSEGKHTLNVIRFFKNHHYYKFVPYINKIWMIWLNSLSFSLWYNEYNNTGNNTKIYNLIEQNSREFFENKHWHNPKDALFVHLQWWGGAPTRTSRQEED